MRTKRKIAAIAMMVLSVSGYCGDNAVLAVICAPTLNLFKVESSAVSDPEYLDSIDQSKYTGSMFKVMPYFDYTNKKPIECSIWGVKFSLQGSKQVGEDGSLELFVNNQKVVGDFSVMLAGWSKSKYQLSSISASPFGFEFCSYAGPVSNSHSLQCQFIESEIWRNRERVPQIDLGMYFGGPNHSLEGRRP